MNGYVSSRHSGVVKTDEPPVRSNRLPTIRFLGLTGVGARNRASAPGYTQRALGRVAQRESARFTRGRSLVRSQPRPLDLVPRGLSRSRVGTM